MRVPADLTVGKLLLIKGTDVSFYIPPTGVGVVPDEPGAWVREALTLERLEYCILVDESGKKRYERGPQVVFPAPTEAVITQGGARKFRAIELSEIQGLHVKVIAPYTEDGVARHVGDELFITGKQTAIYFPREEHALVRSDGHDKHFAVAVPAGEARYVMNKQTGAIRTVRGPAMLLPNPVEEVIVRRALTARECATWYPGNAEVLAHNRALRHADGAPVPAEAAHAPGTTAPSFEAVDRSNTFTKPRTLMIDTRFEGAPAVGVWVGYAVMVVDKQGRRRVEQGPQNLILAYDETLEMVQLSTGTPKTTERLVETVYLRVLGNKVSDRCVVETADHVEVALGYAMRVSFEGEPARWFEVENYVKLLCDHVRSVLKGSAKRHPIEGFYAHAVDLVRDAILGRALAPSTAPDVTDVMPVVRPGMWFPEIGMRVTDVEVLGVDIEDPAIAALLGDAQHEAVEASINLLRATRGLELTARREAIARGEAEARADTGRRLAELEVAATGDRLRVGLAQLAAELEQAARQREAALARSAIVDAEHGAQLARDQARAQHEGAIARARQGLVLEALRAEVDAAVARFGAAQGGFSEALLALSNADTLAKVAEAMSVQAFVGGKTLTDVIDKVFAGTPLEGVIARVQARTVPSNGHALPTG